MKTNFLLRLPTGLKTRLQEQAKEQDMTLTALIVQALWEYVKKQDEKKPA